jgi:hypothetical protein
MSGKQLDVNAQGYARVNAINELNATTVSFGDQFIGQQRVAVMGLDPIVPEQVAAKWIDKLTISGKNYNYLWPRCHSLISRNECVNTQVRTGLSSKFRMSKTWHGFKIRSA